MMRIHTTETDGRLMIYVEGRLSGAFVRELDRCWRQAQAGDPVRRISVDLNGVTCIDRAGRSLLRLLHLNGVSFLRAGLATQDVLDDVTSNPLPSANHAAKPDCGDSPSKQVA